MRLQRYILGRLVTTTAWVTVAAAMLVLPPIVLTAVSKLGGVSLSTLLAYLPFQLVELFPYLMPVVCLIAVTHVYGSLTVDREWTAMAFSGRRPAHGIAPGIAFALVASAVSCALLNDVFPDLRYEQRRRIRAASREALTGLFPGRSEIRIDNFALIAARRVEDTLYDVIVRLPEGLIDSDTPSVHARAVTLGQSGERLTMRFTDAWIGQGARQSNVGAIELEVPYARLLGDVSVDRTRVKYRRSSALRQLAATDALTDEERTPLVFEVHRRLALGTCCGVLALLGVATGLRLRQGVTLPATIASVCYALLYFIGMIRIAEVFGLAGRLHPALAAWSVNITAGVIGAIALLRATRR